jgi:hypothetical protein
MSSALLPEIVLIHLHPSKVNPMFSRKDCSHYFTSWVYPILTLMGAATFNSSRAVRSRRVPSVGGYDEDSAGRHRTTILLIGCCSGAVFGAIHCLGWNDTFQGRTEQLLWRVASLEIVLTPVAILMGRTIQRAKLSHLWD